MYQLLVSDFDGTLVDSDEGIPLSTMIEIDNIRQQGIKFVVATERILKSVLDYNKDFPFLDYIISCNGAYVYDVCNRKVLLKKSLGGSIIKKIKKLYSNCDIYLCTIQELNLCRQDVVYSQTKNRRVSFSDFYNANKENIYQLEILFSTKKERDSAFLELQELKIKANISKVDKDKKKYLIEIIAKDVNKALGLEKICKKEHIALDNVVYIGNTDSDIPIFLSVGMSISMDNSSKKLKKISSMITTSNDTKGLEKAIKKIF